MFYDIFRFSFYLTWEENSRIVTEHPILISIFGEPVMLLLLVPTGTARDQGRKERFSFSTSFCREQQRFTNEMYPGHLYEGIPQAERLNPDIDSHLGQRLWHAPIPGKHLLCLNSIPREACPVRIRRGYASHNETKVC